MNHARSTQGDHRLAGLSSLAWLGLAAPLSLVAMGACGYPDFQFGPGATTGSGGAGSSSSASGGSTSSVVATSTSTSSSVTSSSALSSSSTGGPVTGCSLTKQDCPSAGDRCTIADEETGDTICSPEAASPTPVFSHCVDDSECVKGTWCDHRTKVCMRFCAKASDCGTGKCYSAQDASQAAVPGATVCTADCDPEDAAAICGGGATCSYNQSAFGGYDCVYTGGTVPAGSSCASANCAPDLVCVSDGTTKTCHEWCHEAGTDGDCSDTFQTCSSFTTLTPQHDGHTYGFCEDF